MLSDSEIMVGFRGSIEVNGRHLTQRQAADFLMCSPTLIAYVEGGKARLTPARVKRIEELVAAFKAGGMEAVNALPPWARPSKEKTPGGCRTVSPADAEEMVGWRVALGLTQRQAVGKVGLSLSSIRAIEYGNMRITDRVRGNMETAEREFDERNRR